MNDIFDEEAKRYFESMRLPYDKGKIFILGNLLADYSLRGSVDRTVTEHAVRRVERLQKSMEQSK